jgi:hypothetical protein
MNLYAFATRTAAIAGIASGALAINRSLNPKLEA